MDTVNIYFSIADDGISGEILPNRFRSIISYYMLFYESLTIADTFFLNNSAINKSILYPDAGKKSDQYSLKELISHNYIIPALRSNCSNFVDLYNHQVDRHGHHGYDIQLAHCLDEICDSSQFVQWDEQAVSKAFRSRLINEYSVSNVGTAYNYLQEFLTNRDIILRRDIRKFIEDPTKFIASGNPTKVRNILKRYKSKIIDIALMAYATNIPNYLNIMPLINTKLLPIKVDPPIDLLPRAENAFYLLELPPRWLINSQALASMPMNVIKEIRKSTSHKKYIKYMKKHPFLTGSSPEVFAKIFDNYMEESQNIYFELANNEIKNAIKETRKRNIAIASGNGVFGILLSGISVAFPLLPNLAAGGILWSVFSCLYGVSEAMRGSPNNYIKRIGVVATDANWLAKKSS